jgi:hypothetical protein
MAAGSTYTPIATASPSGVNSYTFSSIPSTYTDLVLVGSFYSNTNDVGVNAQFNGDTGTNYSYTVLIGTGSAAQSARASNTASANLVAYNTGVGSTNGVYCPAIMNLMNYSNTSTYKTIMTRGFTQNNGGNGEVTAYVNTWRSTAAINSIKVYYTSGNMASGTTLTLYGIAAA